MRPGFKEALSDFGTDVHFGLKTVSVYDSKGWDPANEGETQNTLDEGTVDGL